MSRDIGVQALKRSSLFVELGEQELQELEKLTRTVTLRKGSPLRLPSDPGGSIYLLKSGRIKIVRISPDGREFILDIVEPHEIFGEMSILDEEHEEIMGEALEDSSVCAIPSARFRHLIRSKPELSLKIAQLMGLRRKKIERRLESVVFQSVPKRLANLLLQLSRDCGVPDRRGILLRIRLSQQDIGNLIGASREAVNVTLSNFRRQGLINHQGRQLIILQPRPLQQLA